MSKICIFGVCVCAINKLENATMKSAKNLIQISTSNRYDFIDVLKAFAIFLVVYGHLFLSTFTHRWIYSFHMPLFIMISGFLLSSKHLDMTLSDLAKDLLYKYIFPYTIFYVIYIVQEIFLRNISLADVFLFYFDWDNSYYLWFLIILFFCRISIHFSLRMTSKWVLLAISLIVANVLIYFAENSNLHLFLMTFFCSFFYYILGFCLKDYIKASEYSKKILLIIAIIALIISLIAPQTLVYGAINSGFNGIKFLYIPISLFGILALGSISMLLKPNVAFLWLSKNTLLIYGTHWLILKMSYNSFLKIHEIIFNVSATSAKVYYALLSLIPVFILAVPLKYIFNRLFPKIFRA